MSNSAITPLEVDLPFGVDGAGRIAFTSDLGKQTRNHIFSVIGTNLGERVMRGEYGTDLLNHLFEPNDEVHLERLQNDISEAIRIWAPEVTLTGVDLTTDQVNGIVNVEVRFRLANDNEQVFTITTPIPTA